MNDETKKLLARAGDILARVMPADELDRRLMIDDVVRSLKDEVERTHDVLDTIERGDTNAIIGGNDMTDLGWYRGGVPIPMRLRCPSCGELHIDEGEFETKPHHTHCCQNCGEVWRPAVVATVGVRFLPKFKNEAPRGR